MDGSERERKREDRFIVKVKAFASLHFFFRPIPQNKHQTLCTFLTATG